MGAETAVQFLASVLALPLYPFNHWEGGFTTQPALMLYRKFSPVVQPVTIPTELPQP